MKKRFIGVIISCILMSLSITSCMKLSAQDMNTTIIPDSISESSLPDVGEDINPMQLGSKPPLSEIVKRVSPAVVGLSVRYNTVQNGSAGSLGSGVLVHSDGYIITNNHVASNARDIEVVFEDGSKLPGIVLWSDVKLDLAVVKVEGQAFPTVTMGKSESISVGDSVIAIGTPLNLKFQHTVTSGIISAKHRTLTIPSDEGIAFMEDLIQTDASINPGNSGGPLISMDGKVIGINTLKVAEAEGIGFAIPIDICVPIINHIVKDNSYTTPYLGIMVMDKEIASYLGEKLDIGVRVMAVDKSSPAYEVGIREGCVIIEVNGIIIESVLDLRRQIYEIGVGQKIEIAYKKDETIFKVKCYLKSG